MWVIICWSFHNRQDTTNWLCDMFTIWIYCNLPSLLDSLRKHAFFGVQIAFSRAKCPSRWGAKVWGLVIPVVEQSTLDLDVYERYHFLLMEDLCSNTQQTNDRILEGPQWHLILADMRTWHKKSYNGSNWPAKVCSLRWEDFCIHLRRNVQDCREHLEGNMTVQT